MSDEQPRPRVLVVDDDEASRRMVEIALRDVACDVIASSDPRAVHDLVREHEPVVLVIDVMMPHLDGPSVVKSLRADDTHPMPKIVLWSALDAVALARRAEACGADGVVLKVAGPRALVERIGEWLELWQS